jgi:UDP-glucose 4-epimerase
MEVLVTGGAGYIGSITAAALLEAGHTVTVFDDLSTGHREQVPEGARFVRGHTEDEDGIARAAEGADACVHFAASIEAGESMRRPEDFFVNNAAGTMHLLRALHAARVRRFILSSTAAVYGVPAYTPIDENHPTEPANTYGESKLLVERALTWFGRIHGLRYAALRYFNAAGSTGARGEMHEPETHLIPLVLRVAAGQAERAVIFGDDYETPDGTCVRDYIHVADLADAHVRALQALDSNAAIICNLGNGTGFSVREVIESCRRVTGHEIPADVAPRRAGDPPVLVADSKRARALLDWEPKHPGLDDIVASAWEFARAR